MIILHPGIGEMDSGLIIVLMSAIFMSISAILVKKLLATETPEKSVAWTAIMISPLSLIPALFVWQWPVGETWA